MLHLEYFLSQDEDIVATCPGTAVAGTSTGTLTSLPQHHSTTTAAPLCTLWCGQLILYIAIVQCDKNIVHPVMWPSYQVHCNMRLVCARNSDWHTAATLYLPHVDPRNIMTHRINSLLVLDWTRLNPNWTTNWIEKLIKYRQCTVFCSGSTAGTRLLATLHSLQGPQHYG